jgi:hypothetical protein
VRRCAFSTLCRVSGSADQRVLIISKLTGKRNVPRESVRVHTHMRAHNENGERRHKRPAKATRRPTLPREYDRTAYDACNKTIRVGGQRPRTYIVQARNFRAVSARDKSSFPLLLLLLLTYLHYPLHLLTPPSRAATPRALGSAAAATACGPATARAPGRRASALRTWSSTPRSHAASCRCTYA